MKTAKSPLRPVLLLACLAMAVTALATQPGPGTNDVVAGDDALLVDDGSSRSDRHRPRGRHRRCSGLKRYEIVRSPGPVATCSDGNNVLGGTCTGPNAGAPNADGTAWECDFDGEVATAICARVCSELPPATGACCVDGECFELTAAECGADGGEYLGDGVACADQCADTPECVCEDQLTPIDCFNCLQEEGFACEFGGGECNRVELSP